jgi:A/G-specific adenine glycosylase
MSVSNSIASALIDWYRENRILYPWRETRDPYKVWLSEILLQQTRIAVALPFYKKIVGKYPALEDLAESDCETFVAEWSGIGYYGRARNMHACARVLQKSYGGKFPEQQSELLKLPGIGRYTAGALRNLCFDQLTPAVDGNISRVLTRISLIQQPQGSKDWSTRVEGSFNELGAGTSSSEFFQSLMELGERICLPKPDCLNCPVNRHCAAFAEGMQEKIPQPREKRKQLRMFWYHILLSKNGKLGYVQNPDRAFLSKAWLFPDLISPVSLSNDALEELFKDRWGIEVSELIYSGTVAHSVTFRRLIVKVLKAHSFSWNHHGVRWLGKEDLNDHPTSSLVGKILKLPAISASTFAVDARRKPRSKSMR